MTLGPTIEDLTLDHNRSVEPHKSRVVSSYSTVSYAEKGEKHIVVSTRHEFADHRLRVLHSVVRESGKTGATHLPYRVVWCLEQSKNDIVKIKLPLPGISDAQL